MRKAMRTTFVRFASCGLLMALSATFQHALPQAARAAPLAQATATQNRFCYSWSLNNNTADEVDALTVSFSFKDPAGTGQVSDVYAGPDNPFAEVTSDTVSLPPDINDTVIKWFSGTLSAGDMARVAFCNNAPNSISSFVWVANNAVVQPGPRTLGLQWEWSTPRKLTVRLTNTQAETMTVTSLWLYEPPQQLETNDLNAQVASSTQLVANLAEDALSLAPNSTETFEVLFGTSPAIQAQVINTAFVPTPNQPFILEATYAPEEDLSEEGRMLVQGFSPRASYLPVVLRQL